MTDVEKARAMYARGRAKFKNWDALFARFADQIVITDFERQLFLTSEHAEEVAYHYLCRKAAGLDP